MHNSELRDKINVNIMKGMHNNLLSNDDLVEIIQNCGSYLNLRTISDYAKENNISYNGVKNFRNKVKLFGVKFIIEND